MLLSSENGTNAIVEANIRHFELRSQFCIEKCELAAKDFHASPRVIVQWDSSQNLSLATKPLHVQAFWCHLSFSNIFIVPLWLLSHLKPQISSVTLPQAQSLLDFIWQLWDISSLVSLTSPYCSKDKTISSFTYFTSNTVFLFWTAFLAEVPDLWVYPKRYLKFVIEKN